MAEANGGVNFFMDVHKQRFLRMRGCMRSESMRLKRAYRLFQVAKCYPLHRRSRSLNMMVTEVLKPEVKLTHILRMTILTVISQQI